MFLTFRIICPVFIYYLGFCVFGETLLVGLVVVHFDGIENFRRAHLKTNNEYICVTRCEHDSTRLGKTRQDKIKQVKGDTTSTLDSTLGTCR